MGHLLTILFINSHDFQGKLFLHAETGTEGGYWAFQDSNAITWVTPSSGVCNELKVVDINRKKRIELTSDSEVFFMTNGCLYMIQFLRTPII